MLRFLLILFFYFPIAVFSQALTNASTITIEKTWSQEPDGYTYPIALNVPNEPVPANGFPVCIVLHGNGGDGEKMIKWLKFTLSDHIVIAPSGYLKSWNISDEKSEAPDLEMIKDLVDKLQAFENVNPNKIRIYGTSNGAGLANRIFIENKNKGIDRICSVVSHLSEAQYHNNAFYYPSGQTGGDDIYDGYDRKTSPVIGRKYLSVSNTDDPIIPYTGGPARVGVSFLHAEEAIYRVAQSQGYTGEKLGSGKALGENVYEFSYLSGQVVHLKGNNGHGTNQIQRDYIFDFLQNDEVVSGGLEKGVHKFGIYPNPTNSYILVTGEIKKPLDYVIHSIEGQKILEGSLLVGESKIVLPQLSESIYFLRLGGQMLKFVKL